MMKLNQCTTILNEEEFVKSHEVIIERNKDNKYFQPYKDRLDEYYKRKREDANKDLRGAKVESI